MSLDADAGSPRRTSGAMYPSVPTGPAAAGAACARVTSSPATGRRGMAIPKSISFTCPAAVTMTKSFLPATTVPGGTSTLTFTIANPNPSPVNGVAFSDPLPALAGEDGVEARLRPGVVHHRRPPRPADVAEQRAPSLSVDLARRRGVPVHAVVMAADERLVRTRNRGRDRPVPSSVVTSQLRAVTAAVAAPESAGIPVTHRLHASGFAVVTGHQCEGPTDLDWHALARMPTLVVLMGLKGLAEISERLIHHGAAASTPAALIARATLPDEQVVVATLGTIAAEAAIAGVEGPATLVVGEVVRVRERISALAVLA